MERFVTLEVLVLVAAGLAATSCSSTASHNADADVGVAIDQGADQDAGSDVLAELDGGPSPSIGLWIDGDFGDWAEVPILATDPPGDADGPFDVTELKAASRGSVLYLSIELSDALNLSSGSSTDRTLRLEISIPSANRHLTVDFRGREAFVDKDPAQQVSWPELGHLVLPTHASARFEMTFDLSKLSGALGSEVQIELAESDALDAPARFKLEQPEEPSPVRTTQRQAGTALRLASLNVLLDGLTDPARGPQIGRLLKSVKADIYCFQEAYQTAAATMAAALQQLDPHDDGAAWQVHQNIDLMIASRGAVHPLPVGPADGWHAAAVVEPGPGKPPLLVLNIHPPCCGYLGSSQDAQRIAVTRAMVKQIETFRSGGYGPPLDQWRDVPVVVIGDWNIVGSREPLDLMLDPKGPALQRWLLRHLVSGHTYTTRATPDKPSSYPPGVLDLLVHSPDLVRRNGFVLQSDELPQADLSQLAIQPDDSFASDHLLLVADFE